MRLLFYIIPSYPVTNLLCFPALLNLPGFTDLCIALPLGLESPQFLARPPAGPHARAASCSSASKSGFQLCIFGKASPASPLALQGVSHSLPGLEQGLIHSSYSTSFILFTCLSPQHDAELLGTSLCYSSPPLAPSPVEC